MEYESRAELWPRTEQTDDRCPFEDIIRPPDRMVRGARVRNIRGIQWYAGKNAGAMGYNRDLECGSAELHTGNQLINGLSTSIEIPCLIDAGWSSRASSSPGREQNFLARLSGDVTSLFFRVR